MNNLGDLKSLENRFALPLQQLLLVMVVHSSVPPCWVLTVIDTGLWFGNRLSPFTEEKKRRRILTRVEFGVVASSHDSTGSKS